MDYNLKQCFDLNNSDKSFKHKYENVYEQYFHSRRNEPLNLLEIGIFKGNSIAAWLDYFPNATIYGIDIFERVSENDISILKNPRVRWAKADSTKTPVHEIFDAEFDIIIDDGLHTPEANMLTFRNFFSQCKGQYFIEDVWPIDKLTPLEKKHPWIRNKDEYTISRYELMLESLTEKGRVTHHDLRSISKQPDSYIIKVERK